MAKQKLKGFKSIITVTPDGGIDIDDFMDKAIEWAQNAPRGKWICETYLDITPQQRGYFHAVVVTHYCDIQQEEFGLVISHEASKEILKKKFSPRRVERVAIGKNEFYDIPYIPSTEKLKKHEYSEFIQKCLNWFIDEFRMPAPEPVKRIK